MIRYIIKDKASGQFLKRTKSYGVCNRWVANIDDATLITTGSAASQIASKFCNGKSYYQSAVSYSNYPVEVIKVGVLLYPEGKQPFVDGLLGVLK